MMARLRRAAGDAGGFSLAELLVVCAVVGMIVAGIVLLQQQGQATYMAGSSRVEVQQNARIALDMMTRELRSALSMTTVTGCNSATTGTDDITFVDQTGATVRYQQVGSELQRNGTAVIGGVQALRVWCFQDDGTTLTATAADVRSLRVQIAVETEEAVSVRSPAYQQATVESRVRLRNQL